MYQNEFELLTLMNIANFHVVKDDSIPNYLIFQLDLKIKQKFIYTKLLVFFYLGEI